jgi:beta-galactosidase/beta-glucuronidase
VLDVGIRRIEVRGDRLLLNGEPIALTGFGMHEDFPIHGRGLNVPLLVRDHELLRWVGANSYRTSHYPYSEEAMGLADRLGVLVIDEIPAVSLNFADAPELVARRLEQCQRAARSSPDSTSGTSPTSRPAGIRRASGLNQKGVFTRDRRPKMAARFLRSRWRRQ